MTGRKCTLFLLLVSLLVFLAACAGEVPSLPTPDQPIVSTRAPIPTPEPGFVSEEVAKLTQATGLSDSSFLGFSAEDWINFGISILIVVGGYLVLRWLLSKVFDWLVRLTSAEAAAQFEAALKVPVRRLVLASLIYVAIDRLWFISPTSRQILLDLSFLVWITLATVVVWRVLDLSVAYYRSMQTDPARLVEIDPALTLLVRFGRVVVIITTISLILAHFGINIVALTAVLGIGGLALSLAARDTIADAIAGVIILFDRPFRVGDRIEIEELGTWGDVVEIGLRTTRIRTRDNRMVIVPNSTINSNQVVNYSYPDPRYRIETMVNVAYGNDVEKVRQIILEAVESVEGVLPDKPVDVLYDEMGESGMIFRVRWWIQTFEDTRRIVDRVMTALQYALDANHIEVPYPTQTVRLESADGGAVGSGRVE